MARIARHPAWTLVGPLAAVLMAQGAPPARAQNEDAVVQRTLAAVVRVKAKIPRDARSAATLGVERDGSGVLVRKGYVATIGYLVVEAESIEVTTVDDKTIAAVLQGYDHASGFALLKLLGPAGGEPLALGNSASLVEGAAALAVPYGGGTAASIVQVVSRRTFSGSWEYLLDSAIFTFPPVQNWSGAALIGPKGELLGLGSLILADAARPGTQSPGNMFVPIELLAAILDDLVERGRARGPARPWLGLTTEELRGRLFIGRVSKEGPAERAGLKSGDLLLGVGDEDVTSLADFYRKVWARGPAGVEVPLKVLQGATLGEVKVRSIDRLEYFRPRQGY